MTMQPGKKAGIIWVVASMFGAVIGAIATGAIFQPGPPGVSEERVREIVAETAPITAMPGEPDLGPAIESYLVANPRVLERVSEALNKQREAERLTAARQLIESNREAIFEARGAVEVGNPAGDITLVELYDYNCGYCRSALPDIATLLDEDPNLRLLLRQFPILSQDSVDAAKVGTLVAAEGVDYWSFHQAMFTSRGQVTLDTALEVASTLGLDAASLRSRARFGGRGCQLERNVRVGLQAGD